MKRNINLLLTALFFYLISFIYRTIYWEDFDIHYLQIILNSLSDTLISFITAEIVFRIISLKINLENKIMRKILLTLSVLSIYVVCSRLLVRLHYIIHNSTTGMSAQFRQTFQMESFQIFDAYVVIAVGSLIFLTFKTFDRYQTEKTTHQNIEKEFIKQQVLHLKTQIGPHFMFNTLNNIYYLIDQKNTKARQVVLKLSDILRYQLYETNTDKVAISTEIIYLKDYIELQNIRKEADFKLEFRNELELDFEISPLILIVLLENAFKFSGSDNHSFIDIHLFIDDNNYFVYKVSNSINTPARDKGHLAVGKGLGLNNLKNRLKIIYGDNASLDIKDDSNIFEATIRIKLQNL